MTQNSMVVPVFSPRNDADRGIRTPKTAELVARKLRGMIVDGELKPDDHLPNEAELMELFSVSRPTLREAIRVLEAERLVEVRRGSRSGAKVCVPGPEVVARPASLLLELSGATVADVYRALEAVEPSAARLLAEEGPESAFDELEQFVDEVVPAEFAAGQFGRATARFHLRMVQLSGSPTLALVSGMVHEIFERNHVAFAQEHVNTDRAQHEANFKLFVRSQRKFIKLLRARDGAGAFTHWQKHMVVSRQFVMLGREDLRVRDLLD
ncbi:GntR family transcriptional regulator [Gordonia sp. ABSL1-1]|uniref:FadR/GntR family transcriptional regulator n=1 Tax=Gordonia sp. ABSL1-1 TaxID=3053923 RepID=UPI0025727A4B|nr:GntR family transcriptional regulator [Gordonia sp. ABSL1-1]MDL9938069.1 GntR family transcriptional regulator [Gordonia sp. ABSL1-1]